MGKAQEKHAENADIAESRNMFKAEFNEYVSIPGNITFYEYFKNIALREKCDSSSKFWWKTNLDANIYSCLKKKGYHPSKRIIITICVGFNLWYLEAEKLLASAGFCLGTNEVDFAYSKLLREYRNVGVQECNKLLEAWGIDKKHHLGSFERK